MFCGFWYPHERVTGYTTCWVSTSNLASCHTFATLMQITLEPHPPTKKITCYRGSSFFLCRPLLLGSILVCRFSCALEHVLGPLTNLFGEGFPYLNRLQKKKLVPTYSNLSTGGPSVFRPPHRSKGSCITPWEYTHLGIDPI